MSAVPYSSFNSPYYPWLVEMGYPELDINTWPDGEWAIIEMQNTPVIPCLTKWKYVLTGLRNIEINKSIVRRFVESIDLRKAEFWEKEIAKTEATEREQVAKEKHSQDIAERMAKAMVQNPDFANRVAQSGDVLGEVRRLRRRIPNYRF